jgi:hypothetical protein
VTPPVRRAHALTIERTEALRHALPAGIAELPADEEWLRWRAALFAKAADTRVRLTLTPLAYRALTGLAPAPGAAGHACIYAHGDRLARPVVYLDPARLADRGAAERVLAHEFMHVKCPSYGHKRAGFDLAQRLLDAVATDPEAGAWPTKAEPADCALPVQRA